jgi:hypothetical protein
MPLEVRNIAIQMRVDDEPGGVAGDGKAPHDPFLAMLGGEDDEPEEANAALIDQCVEAVLAELARRGER